MSWKLAPRHALLGAFAAATLAAAALPVQAKEPVMPQMAGATTYLNGGVGAGDEAYMHRIAKDWPLRMVFSERKDNAFVADVNLKITDHQGDPVLSLPSAGPMTYAKLPPGDYRVTATFGGRTETRNVTLDGKSGADLYFHWKG